MFVWAHLSDVTAWAHCAIVLPARCNAAGRSTRRHLFEQQMAASTRSFVRASYDQGHCTHVIQAAASLRDAKGTLCSHLPSLLHDPTSCRVANSEFSLFGAGRCR